MNLEAPPQETWWKRRSNAQKLVIIIVGLVVAYAALGDDGNGDRAGGDSPESASSGTAAQVATRSDAETSTGDWPSEAAYTADLLDTTSKVATMLDTYAQAAFAAADGEITVAQFADLADTLRDSLRTHRDYFRGTTAPEGYGRSHSLLLQALDKMDEAAAKASRGARSMDLDLIDEASTIMDEGTRLVQQAADALPTR